MTTPPTEPTSDNKTDDLAAYLDGELSREETLALETRLATDPALRRELGQLQKTWDLLDVLPKAKADETFSTTTMSLAADLLKKEAAAKSAFRLSPRIITTLAGILLAVLGLGAGYFAVDKVVQRPKREMESELHLLTNFVTYSRLSENYLGDKNLEFLRLLQSSGLFVAPEGNDAQVQTEPTTLDGLGAEERAEVIRHYQTLKNDTEGKHGPKFDSMRHLAKDIGADPARVSLLRVYDRYYAWLQALPNRRDILKIESEREPLARVELIRASWRIQSQQNLQAMLSDLQVILTAKDYDVFRDWFTDFIAAHESELRQKLPGNESIAIREMERIAEPHRKRMRLYLIYSWKVGKKNAIVPSQEDFIKLTSRLSEEAKKQFSSIEANEDQRRQVVTALVDTAFQEHLPPPVTDEDRAKVLASLSPEEREKLEKLKALELKRELTKRCEEQRAVEPRQRDSEKKAGKKTGSAKSPETKNRNSDGKKPE